MAQSPDTIEGKVQTELLKRFIMIELFKLGVSQTAIGKKLKVQKVTVNSFLKGIKRKERSHAEN